MVNTPTTTFSTPVTPLLKTQHWSQRSDGQPAPTTTPQNKTHRLQLRTTRDPSDSRKAQRTVGNGQAPSVRPLHPNRNWRSTLAFPFGLDGRRTRAATPISPRTTWDSSRATQRQHQPKLNHQSAAPLLRKTAKISPTLHGETPRGTGDSQSATAMTRPPLANHSRSGSARMPPRTTRWSQSATKWKPHPQRGPPTNTVHIRIQRRILLGTSDR